jgi:hypothetical protein
LQSRQADLQIHSGRQAIEIGAWLHRLATLKSQMLGAKVEATKGKKMKVRNEDICSL